MEALVPLACAGQEASHAGVLSQSRRTATRSLHTQVQLWVVSTVLPGFCVKHVSPCTPCVRWTGSLPFRRAPQSRRTATRSLQAGSLCEQPARRQAGRQADRTQLLLVLRRRLDTIAWEHAPLAISPAELSQGSATFAEQAGLTTALASCRLHTAMEVLFVCSPGSPSSVSGSALSRAAM